MDALRDAVLWGYGAFAILLAPVLIRRNLVERIPALYARVFPWIILCAPAWMLVSQWSGTQGIPGTAMGAPKAGDVAVHLGGAGSFLLAGLWSRRDSVSAKWLREWGAWLALLVGVVAMGSLTRGGLLAAISAMLTVLILLPFKAGGKLILAGATAVLLATVWLAWGVSLPGRESRAISPEQIAQNLGSIGGGSRSDLEGTRTWRILWWNSIIDYTVHGQYFWTGKGFGVNLTYDDGIVRDPDDPSRSPHNGHLTVLARTGVPGLVLWVLLQLAFALSMLAGLVRARQARQDTRASLFVWILAYWLAFLVNASFDVYLEGPQGGIWFWCIFGYGLALIASESRAGTASARVGGAVGNSPAPVPNAVRGPLVAR
jgi:O-antigen ligase